jgi:hypothetical protein
VAVRKLVVKLKTPHEKQREFMESPAKRRVIRAGRRGGKTTGMSMLGVERFLEGRRVLYAAPTQDQTDKFWLEVTTALDEPIKAGVYKINKTRRWIERVGTENRIRAKTAWDADSMRGDYADELIFDEFQKMKPEAWEDVGAPMLLDNDGNATFIYTPPKPGDNESGAHAREMYKRAKRDENGRWAAFHFTSFDNPHISRDALDEISEDMDEEAYEREILAQDQDDHPDALWTRETLKKARWYTEEEPVPDLAVVVVGCDPPGKATGAKCGIVVAGMAIMSDGKRHGFVLNDTSLRGRPDRWASAVVSAHDNYMADRVTAEVNNGGDMVESTIKTAAGGERVSVKQVRASRGKAIRAEPVANLYAQGRVHHVGRFAELETQMCNWVPGMLSPDNMDALVWALTDLLLGPQGWVRGVAG